MRRRRTNCRRLQASAAQAPDAIRALAAPARNRARAGGPRRLAVLRTCGRHLRSPCCWWRSPPPPCSPIRCTPSKRDTLIACGILVASVVPLDPRHQHPVGAVRCAGHGLFRADDDARGRGLDRPLPRLRRAAARRNLAGVRRHLPTPATPGRAATRRRTASAASRSGSMPLALGAVFVLLFVSANP